MSDFLAVLAGTLLLTGCSTAGPVSASARTVTQPVQLGEVARIGGQRESDWGASKGEVEVELANREVPQNFREKTGSEYFGVQLLKQAGMCPVCPIQIDGIAVFSRAGAAGVNVVEIEGEIRPATRKGGDK